MIYKKNFKGTKWTKSRKLTTELINKFNKDVATNGHRAWKSFANPNGEYSSIKARIIEHNQKLRFAWGSGTFNKREKVLEAFADYPSNTLHVQHVDDEHAVKEAIFTNKSSQYSNLFDEDNLVRIFGNSELAPTVLDKFKFSTGTSLNFQDFCDFIDTIITSVS